MNKEIKVPIVILLVITALLIGVYWGVSANLKRGGVAYSALASGDNDTKLGAIRQLIDNYYVDSIESDSLMDMVYSAMMTSLDPHSVYLSQKDLDKTMESLRGNFDGVGIMLRMVNDTVRVQQVIPDGPSEKAGVLAGDYILSVDGIDVSGVKMSSDEVISHLRGERKSTANLKIKRLSENGLRYIKVVRDVIKTPSLTYSGMIDSKTGYIHLSQFSGTTYDEFCTAVKQLKRDGMKRMVLDLRGNGGGLLDQAIGVCDELLPGRELIVYTQGAHQKRYDERSHRGGLFCEGDLIVMIDEYSASASEIVAGAIQDNDRGLIVGRRSFGKGLVQQQFELPDHSAVMLTVARYYTPSGRCIQRPYTKGTDEYYKEYLEQIVAEYENDSLISKVTDSTEYHTTKGRIVYGGGAIFPDHPISYKTDTNFIYYTQLINKAIVYEYVFNLVSRTGTSIKESYPTANDFVKRYKVSDAMLEQLFQLGEKKGLRRNTKSIAKFREEIRSRVKGEIAEMLYSTATYYGILLSSDPELQEALTLWKKR